jgi:hypothetical protein
MERFFVCCNQDNRSRCAWKGGYRRAESAEAAQRKPCPHCGASVLAFGPIPPGTRLVRVGRDA